MKKRMKVVNKINCPYCKKEVEQDGRCNCDQMNRLPLHRREIKWCITHDTHCRRGQDDCVLVPASVTFSWDMEASGWK